MTEVELVDIILRILAAAACGAILGWDREASDKPAGLRTNMLVAIGSAAAALAALDLFTEISLQSEGKVPTDPIRIISGVIGGLGFLGAGAIIQSQGRVRGMTTAAAIWVVGGIGVACGLGNFQLAFTTVVITFFVLFALGKFKHSNLAPESVQENGDDTK